MSFPLRATNSQRSRATLASWLAGSMPDSVHGRKGLLFAADCSFEARLAKRKEKGAYAHRERADDFDVPESTLMGGSSDDYKAKYGSRAVWGWTLSRACLGRGRLMHYLGHALSLAWACCALGWIISRRGSTNGSTRRPK